MRVESTLHITLFKDNGHIHSTDCWCEPSSIYLAVVKGLPGATLVVEHNDEVADSREGMLAKRHADPDWVTCALARVPDGYLPPHDEEGRA